MSIHVALHHITKYVYDRPVKLGPQVIRLRPAPHSRTKILAYSLKILPSEHFINWQQDPMGNYQARLVFPKTTREFCVEVDLVAEMAVYNPFDFFLEPEAETLPFNYAAEALPELTPHLVKLPGLAKSPDFQSYIKRFNPLGKRTVDFLVEINQKLSEDIEYLIRLEPGVQTPVETITKGSGSCRDSAWLLVQLLRHLGLAARFVSGYLIQLVPDVKALDGPSGTETDFTDLHAWCEVYLPGAGWIGLDPTSGLLAGEGHIPLACTPSPSGAAPISGMVDEAEVQFSHEMSVARIHESARVTKPYSEDQWQQILDLGQKVDQDLFTGDVRLTMGGEPTFVSIDNRDAPEWNTDALGPSKRDYASTLMHKLAAHYGEGGFLHLGQGKWYPGEQLPRWALSAYWRTDGVPIWQDPDLLANEHSPQKRNNEDAKRFISHLSSLLGLTDEFVKPGYEDSWYYLWRERRLPVNVDPFDSRLDDELERQRLRRVFEHKLDTIVGYALPLKADSDPNTLSGTFWSTGPWVIRDERMYLIPGDSAMGYRLPLDSLPWVSESDYPYIQQQDPFDRRDPLPATPLMQHQIPMVGKRVGIFGSGDSQGLGQNTTLSAKLGTNSYDVTIGDTCREPARFESASWVTRTALVIEARDPMRANGPAAEKSRGGQNSVLYVFMPPLSRLTDYLNLLAMIERTAKALSLPVVIEGYPPPRDERLKVLQVTPDPGVIEVNIHPAHNWGEVVEHTEFLYQAAYESRLCAEKFMIDGKHTGTGGGNHVVLGAATPADSPFLRRPDLLASMLLYWHNHPSLSYLFSGLFIGPTSQAPRIDEARNDQLYELEIALKEISENRKRFGQEMPPWLIDRMLRNILIDVTGNTHRSEFCIDKLYSPDSNTGRLGLLELRGFEMPPHARMSIVQQLLIRALIARFWNAPYQARATRWSTELHDRFMLGFWIRQDLNEVLSDLADHGYQFAPSWYEPHFEFRFAKVGEFAANDTVITVRNALEPWHVLGEQGAVGGTVRYVDSSVERLEVSTVGFNPSRHAITVNGHPLPMHPTGSNGQWIGAVRYKAWNPPSALHPTIGVQTPLTFDLIDTWNQRSIAGGQYHVAHPGGRNYDTLPINAYEAESRRLARFFSIGHSPGVRPDAMPSLMNPISLEFPFTLDLRTVQP